MPAATSNQQPQKSPMVDQNEAKERINEDVSEEPPLYKKAAIGLALVLLIVLVIIDSATTQYLRTVLEGFLGWVGDNPVAGFFGVIVGIFPLLLFFV